MRTKNTKLTSEEEKYCLESMLAIILREELGCITEL